MPVEPLEPELREELRRLGQRLVDAYG
jgi:hypothetical protein